MNPDVLSPLEVEQITLLRDILKELRSIRAELHQASSYGSGGGGGGLGWGGGRGGGGGGGNNEPGKL